MSGRISSPIVVGRDAELAEMEAAVNADGDGSAVFLVAGEPGIGKSRLVRELAVRVRRAGGFTLLGESLPLATKPPFRPWIDAFKGLVRAVPPQELAQALEPDPGLVKVVLQALGEGSSDESRPEASNLYDRVDRTLERLAAAAPTVVVIEDLHWADRSSLDLFVFAARRSIGRLTVVGTYRVEDATDSGPLIEFVSDLERLPTVSRIDLHPLDASAVERQVAAILGHKPDAGLIRTLVDRADGNPFFVEELIAGARVPHDAAVPLGVVRAIEARAGAVGPDTRSLLRVLAAIGRQADADLVAQVSRVPPDTLYPLLREAVRAGFLRPTFDVGKESFQFRHALMREAFYAEIVPGERSALHATIAEELMSATLASTGTSAELAGHWDLAGRATEALRAHADAGEDASRVFANHEALHHFARAEALYDAVAGPDLPAVDRDLIRSRAVDAAAAVGDLEQALALQRRRIADLDPRAEPERAALAQSRLAGLLWEAGDDDGVVEAHTAAMSHVDSISDSAKAAIQAAESAWLMVSARYAESRAVAEQAVAAAESAGARADESRARAVLGVDLAYLGFQEAGIEELRKSLAIAQEIDLAEAIRRALVNLVGVLLRAGRRDEAIEMAREGSELAHRYGMDRSFGRLLTTNAAIGLYDMGRWDEAEETADAALEGTGDDLAAVYLHLVLANIAIGRGDGDGARSHLALAEKGRARSRDPSLLATILGTAADLANQDGRFADARVAVNDGLEALRESDEKLLAQHLITIGVAAQADRAALARARRLEQDVNDAVAEGERLAGASPPVASLDAPSRGVEGELAAERLSTQAELERLQGRSAIEEWRAAVSAWDSADLPWPAMHARYRLSEAALSRRADRVEAEAALRAAHLAARDLGAMPLLSRLENLARRARVSLGAATPAEPAAEPTVPPDLGLTTREREVLELLGRGLTNKRIADMLFISEKTASVHVSNILGKLGVGSRVEAAGIAIRLGLLGEEAADDAQVAINPSGSANDSTRRVAMMFTDIVESTRLLDVIGDRAWRDLLQWHDATLRSVFVDHGGIEVDHAGDGFFVVFPTAAAGLRCAVSIQRTLGAHRRANGFAPSVRIGLHEAVVTMDGGAYRGRGVHEAARIAGAAGADEILASKDFVPPGDRAYPRDAAADLDLPGLSKPISVVRIAWQ